ncbi:MAG TPA: DUF1552 domain-containing protein [Polyangiales bacterium]|nr:DUF1552 domain-containing protein [Polyangiales bacterium]
MKRVPLHRRAVLRGFAGTAVALPLLELMLESPARAQQQPPRRYLVTFGGLSVGNPQLIVPNTVGRSYDVKRALAPLSSVQNEVSVVSELRLPASGAGGWTGRWHSSSVGPLISGMRASGTAAPGNPLGHGDPVAKGVTSDQVVADAIAGTTRFRSLELRAQPEVYRENDGTFGIISYRRDAATGKLQANEPQASPRLAFDSLFTGFSTGNPDDSAQRRALLERDKSILDLVRDRTQSLLARLGSADRRRVERHFDEIRDLERRITEIPAVATTAGCKVIADPGQDEAVRKVQKGNVEGDIPRYLGYANEEKRAQVMSDLLHMAFTCDLTRSATLAYTFAQCFIDTKALLGIQQTDVHELGHGAGSDQDKADAFAWHIKHFAYLVAKLRDTPEGAGNVLDNTVMVFMPEGGWDDGEPHSGENMVALIAGKAGGLKPGKHIKATGKHPVQVLISAMNAAGVATQTLGEITGPLPELFT